MDDRSFCSRRVAGKAVSREGSCSCMSEVVVEGDTVPKDWWVDIVAVVAERHLSVAPVEAVSVVAGQRQDCKAEEDHHRVGKEECSAVAERAVVACCAVVEEQE